MLTRYAGKLKSGLSRKFSLLPPWQFHHILTSGIYHPLLRSRRHKPRDLVVIFRIEALNTSMIQVIVMVMAYDNGVYVGQVVDFTGWGTISFWPHELHGGTPVAKYRVRQDGNPVHLNQYTGMAYPHDLNFWFRWVFQFLEVWSFHRKCLVQFLYWKSTSKRCTYFFL